MSERRPPPRDWPNRDSSRQLRAGGMGWHVQVMGDGPVVLLLHGTASSSHSFRALAPLLARHFTVVAPDLPGHGFTETPGSNRLSLPGMAAALRALLQAMDMQPVLVAGHSAGAAVALQMVLDRGISPAGVVGLNPALLPLSGAAGQFFSPLAKLVVGLPLLPGLFAWRARQKGVVERLLKDTGSRIDPQGVAQYARLMADSRHTGAALSMMAQWDLKPLIADLPTLRTPLLMLVGGNDRAVPPTQAERVARRVRGARVRMMLGLGHLAHEEDPGGTAALIEAFAEEVGA